MLDLVGKRVRTKLVSVLGEEQAEVVAGDVLGEMGLQRLSTADQRSLFGRHLVRRGGVLAVLGHSIQTQAILHGARLLPETS